MEPAEPVLMNIYQCNSYRNNSSWLHFNDDSSVQERGEVKDQQSHISVFVAYQTIPGSILEHQPRIDNSIPCKAIWYIFRDIEQRQEKETYRTNQGSKFQGSSFSRWDNVRVTIQFRGERQPQDRKRWFPPQEQAHPFYQYHQCC